MGGIVGTALMLLEASGVGASLDPEAIPRPPEVPLEQWLLAFPSYAFLLSVPPQHQHAVLAALRPARDRRRRGRARRWQPAPDPG